MKTMLTSAVTGLALLFLGIAVGDELILINPMKVLFLTAAVLFIIAGVAALVVVWENRGARFRRTRRGRRA